MDSENRQFTMFICGAALFITYTLNLIGFEPAVLGFLWVIVCEVAAHE